MSRDVEELREKAIETTKEELRGEIDQDEFLSKAISMLDQVNKNLNEEVEKFRDWYSIHFPELEEEIGDNKDFLNILVERGVQREDLDSFSNLREDSTGSKILLEDSNILEKTAENLQMQYDYTEKLENYIEQVAEEQIPNLKKLLGANLAARLISLAGGLDDLSKKPSSTVQMLGAEKALFRYLRGEGTPPKHGVLFQHRFVSSLPDDKRGKMARFLANKAVIAARIDKYGGEKDKGKELFKEAEKKFKDLKKDND